MKITSAQIKQPSKHFQLRKGPKNPNYWRHLVRDWDKNGRKVSFDFVQSAWGKKGMRVNIRLLSANADLYKRNGRPVLWDWKTAECWIRPDGTVEDVDDKKANKRQAQDAASEDWRPFMLALYDQLNREGA